MSIGWIGELELLACSVGAVTIKDLAVLVDASNY
jgi:hypothetical protein